MPKCLLFAEIEIVSEAVGAAGPRAGKMWIVEETLEEGSNIWVVARRNDVVSNLLYR